MMRNFFLLTSAISMILFGSTEASSSDKRYNPDKYNNTNAQPDLRSEEDIIKMKKHQKYLDGIGWSFGRCSRVGLTGLTDNCDVLPKMGPGANPPRAKQAGLPSQAAPISLKCPQNGMFGGLTDEMIVEVVVDARILARFTLTYYGGLPEELEVENTLDLNRQTYASQIKFDLKRQSFRKFDKAAEMYFTTNGRFKNVVMSMLGDIDQFICNGKPFVYKKFEDLLLYNRIAVGL